MTAADNVTPAYWLSRAITTFAARNPHPVDQARTDRGIMRACLEWEELRSEFIQDAWGVECRYERAFDILNGAALQVGPWGSRECSVAWPELAR